MRRTLVFLLFFLLLCAPFPLESRPLTSDTIAPGVTAAVSIYPSPAAKVPPDQAIRRAFEEGRRLFKSLDTKSTNKMEAILVKVCRQISEWTHGLFQGDPRKVRNGYVVDRMAGVLKSQGYTDFMVQSGSIWRTMGRDGSNYWRLTIPDAHGSQNGLCRVSLESSSVATADTRSLPPNSKTDLRSVTVITRNATNASALARTALIAGRDGARSLLNPFVAEGFGVILEDQHGKIQTIGDVTAACFEE